ncbi:MAG: ubiquitin-like domain-containing protein [Ardenticatenales bacterium]
MSTPHRALPPRADVPATTPARQATGRAPRAAAGLKRLRPWLSLAAALVVAFLFPAAQRHAARSFTLDVGGRTQRAWTSAATVRLALAERGLGVGSEDRVSPSRDARVGDGGRVTVRFARMVTVVSDGHTRSVTERAIPLRALLADAGIRLGPSDAATLDGQPWPIDAALPARGGAHAPPAPKAPMAPSAPRQAMLRGAFWPHVAFADEIAPAAPAAPAAPGAVGAWPAATTLRLRAAGSRQIAAAMAALHPGDRPLAPVGDSVVRVLRARPIDLVDAGVRASVFAAGETVGQALAAAGIAFLPGDAISPALDTPLAYAPEIRIERGIPFALAADGLTRELRARAATVGAALADAGVGLAGRDIVRPAADTALSAGLEVAVTRVRDVVETREVEIPYRTQAEPDPDRPLDEVAILANGVPGLAQQRVEVTYHGGRVRGRRVLDEVIVREPVDERVSYGTRISWGTVQTEAGPMRYWRKLRVYATSYSAARAGTPRSAPWYGHTRIGEMMRKGIVAVDPRLIPLRTNLYVDGYGLGLAGDTGGGIKRLHIDLGYDDDNYIGWHQYVDVYLLEPAPPPERMPWVMP